jgi:hypothetical protein
LAFFVSNPATRCVLLPSVCTTPYKFLHFYNYRTPILVLEARCNFGDILFPIFQWQ